VNPLLARLQPYPFEKLRQLFADVKPNPAYPAISLGIGEPKHPTPAFIQQALADNLAGLANYPTTAGSDALRAAICNWLERRYDLPKLDPATDVLPVNGSREALFALAQAVIDPAAKAIVVCPNPFYQIYEGAAFLAGAEPYFVNSDPARNFAPDFATVPADIWSRVQLLFICTPGNPTGAVLSREEIDAIGEVCIAHDLWIVADEVYADMTYDAPFSSPFDRPQLRERTLAVSSISKSHALPGFRAGWVAAPAHVIERLVLVAEAMLFGSQPFIEDALVVALSTRHPEVDRLRAAFRERAVALVEELGDAPHSRARMPEGGMFVMVDVRSTGLSGEQFAWRLLEEHGVGVMPGESFGSGGAGHVRIALTVDAPVLRDACTKIRALAEQCAAGR